MLAVALDTFVRYGYRKTSMEEIAHAADISRPGLYLLFGSKQELFTAAITAALDRAVTAIDRLLADTSRPLPDRLLDAFDQWTGRYIGTMSREVNAMAEQYSDLLGPVAAEYPPRFAALVTAALTEPSNPAPDSRASAVARTLISTSIGIKHQVASREDFLERMATAIDLLLGR